MNHQDLAFTRRHALAALAWTAALPTGALAQPERAIHLMVASSAGATIDVIARTVQPALSQALATPVVVENVAGASGVIAMQTLARSAPDGSMLVLHTNNLVIAPMVMKPAPYDAATDFTPISVLGAIPLVLVTNTSKITAKNAKEFVALLKSDAGKLNYGSSGTGTTLHLAVEMIQSELGVKVNHVPYKGVAPMVNDLLGGQIDFIVTSLPPVQGHIKSGALRAIGMLTDQRLPSSPDIATFTEQGFPKFNMEVWFAVLGPKGMSPAAVKKVHDALSVTFGNPALKDKLEKQGNIIKVSTPSEAMAVIRQDSARYSALVKKIDMKQ